MSFKTKINGSNGAIETDGTHLDISATSLVLPKRATGSNNAGAMYFDTTSNSFQGYNGSDWVTIQSGLQNSSGTTKVEIGASSNDIVFTNDSSESMRLKTFPTPPDSAFILSGSNKSLTDVINNSTSLTLNGGASLSNTNGAVLDGVNDYMTIPSSLLGFGTSDFTISFWAKCRELTSSSSGFLQLISIGYHAANSIIVTTISSTELIYIYDAGLDATYYTSPAVYFHTGTGGIGSGIHHYILTRVNGVIKLFIDKTEYISYTNTLSLPTGDYHIGYAVPRNSTGDVYPAMDVYRLDIWKTTGFSSSSDISAIYEMGYKNIRILDVYADVSFSSNLNVAGATTLGSSVIVKTSTPYTGIDLYNSSNSNILAGIRKNTDDSAYFNLYSGASTKISFNSKSGANSYINNGGNVGIGTTNPQSKLDVSGTTQFNAVDNSQNLFSVFTNNGDSLTKTDTFNISRQVGDYISDTTGGHSYSRIGCFDWIYRIKIGTLGDNTWLGQRMDTSSFNININYTFAMSRNSYNSDHGYKIVGKVNIDGIVYKDTEGTYSNFYINDYYENRKLSVGKYNDGSYWYVIRHNGYLYLGFWHRQRYTGSGSTSDGSTNLPMRLTGTINTVFSGNNVSIEKPIVFDNVNKDLDVVAAPAIDNIFPTSTGPLWDSNLTSSSTLDELTLVPTEIHFPIGNVGIGSTQPDSRLTIGSSSESSNQYLKIATAAGYTSGIKYLGGTANEWYTQHIDGTSQANRFAIGVDSSEFMSIINGGNVGIGTTNPQKKLDVNGDVLVTGDTIEIDSNGTYSYFVGKDTNTIFRGTNNTWLQSQGGPIMFYANSDGITTTERMRISSAGNVGIGTTNPQSQLHIYETTGTSATSTAGSLILQHGDNRGSSSILFKSATGVSGSNDYAWIEYDDGDGSAEDRGLLTIGINNDKGPSGYRDTIRFNVAGTEVIRFATDNAGNRLVGIGNAFPSSTLDVNGTMNVTGATTLGSALNVDGLIDLYKSYSFNSGNNINIDNIKYVRKYDFASSTTITDTVTNSNTCLAKDGSAFPTSNISTTNGVSVDGTDRLHIPNITLPTTGKFIIGFKYRLTTALSSDGYESIFTADITGTGITTTINDNSATIRFGNNLGLMMLLIENKSGSANSFVRFNTSYGRSTSVDHEWYFVFEPNSRLKVFYGSNNETPTEMTSSDFIVPSGETSYLNVDVPSYTNGTYVLRGGLHVSNTYTHPPMFPHFYSDNTLNAQFDLKHFIVSETSSQGRIKYDDEGSLAGMKFETNQIERLRINTQGNVGIGTTNPQATLDVDGSLNVTGATTLGSTLDVDGSLNVTGATTLGSTLDVGGTMNVTGATTLGSTLDVDGSLNVTGATTLGSTLTVAKATTLATTLDVAGASTFGSSLIVNGNVGIGSAQPSSKLDVNGSFGAGTNGSNFTVDADGDTNIAGTLTVTGDVSFNSTLDVNDTVIADEFIGNGVIPIGGIIMWSGTIDSNGNPNSSTGTVYSNWHLCDGTSTTPNLTDKFIVGSGNTYDIGDTGGANEVSLSEAQLPSHTHTISSGGAHLHEINNAGSGDKEAIYAYFTKNQGTDNADIGGGDQGNNQFDLALHDYDDHKVSTGSHTHTISNTGSGNTHENRPPYYALAYIMRIS